VLTHVADVLGGLCKAHGPGAPTLPLDFSPKGSLLRSLCGVERKKCEMGSKREAAFVNPPSSTQSNHRILEESDDLAFQKYKIDRETLEGGFKRTPPSIRNLKNLGLGLVRKWPL